MIATSPIRDDFYRTNLGRALHVFPLAPNSKKPLRGSHGFKDAKTLPFWFGWDWSRDCNVGIATGAASGLTVVDLDGEVGWGSYQDIVRSGLMPRIETLFTVRTPRGYHLYFAYNGEGCSAGVVAPGIDIRGDGGYVVGPRSVTEKGIYQVFGPGNAGVNPLPMGFAALASKPVSNVWTSGTAKAETVPKLSVRIFVDEKGFMRAEGVSE